MAKSTSPIKNLTRFLDRVSSPIYIVSPTSTILYANEACCHWIGLANDDLVSTKCVYSSKPLNDEREESVKGLAPPPELLDIAKVDPSKKDSAEKSRQSSLDQMTALVCVTQDETKQWRRATMLVLRDDDSTPVGILVACNSITCAEPHDTDPIKTSQQPELLHNALLELSSSFKKLFKLENLIGTSSFASRMRRQVESAIGANIDLLMVGPPGSGKEHLAKTIHAESSSSGETNLIPIHCSVADQQLIQNNIKEIIVDRQNNEAKLQDWLLLLNVDQLGEASQNELLGFFQLPAFSLRTIATSSKSLVELSQRGKFNTELAHYLSTMTITLPPLSDRQLDIPLLAQALLERDNDRRPNQLGGFSVEAMERLTEFNWPGNIDQLNRTVQQAAENTTGSQITADDLPDDFRYALSAMRIGKPVDVTIELDSYLAEIEKELISRAMTQAKGNKSQASKHLGISRAKLLRRLQQLGLSQPQESSEPEQIDESAFEELDS